MIEMIVGAIALIVTTITGVMYGVSQHGKKKAVEKELEIEVDRREQAKSTHDEINKRINDPAQRERVRRIYERKKSEDSE